MGTHVFDSVPAYAMIGYCVVALVPILVRLLRLVG